MLLASALAGCSGTTARIQQRDVRIAARAQAVVAGALVSVDVRSEVGTFNSRDERENYAASLRSLLQAANLFGGDAAAPYSLRVTIAAFDIPKASFSGFDSTLETKYELKDAKGQVVYTEQISSAGSDDTGSALGPVRQSRSRTVAVANNIETFVQRLGGRLQQLAAATLPVAASSPAPAPAPAHASPPAPATASSQGAPPASTATAPRPAALTNRPNAALPDLAPVTLAPLAVAGDIDFGRYHALIIGNDAYRHIPVLKTAISDATRLEQILRESYGFETQLLRNAERDQIVSALADYRRRLQPADNLLIYYAGHGWVDEQADEGYWLPVDAGAEDPARWVSNATLTTTLRTIPAKHILVIADSCFSGKLTRGVNVQPRTHDYVRRLMSKKARTALTSGGLEPVLDSGGKGNHSVFASALFDALTANTGVVDTSQLFNVIRREVALAADQFPEYGDIRRAGHDGGDFVFVRRKR
ncbi:MAG: caspase family protein [Rubrivivax sp.]|nr:caspase family protein [Rubrivivax sp.]